MSFSSSSGGKLVDVLVDRIAGLDLVLDAVEASEQHCRERQVRVALRIWAAELDALGLWPAANPPEFGRPPNGCADE